jgi:hypothetical protein
MAEFVSDKMTYLILRSSWCDIVLKVHAPAEDKIDNMKDSFCEELEYMFDEFHIQTLLEISVSK